MALSRKSPYVETAHKVSGLMLANHTCMSQASFFVRGGSFHGSLSHTCASSFCRACCGVEPKVFAFVTDRLDSRLFRLRVVGYSCH